MAGERAKSGECPEIPSAVIFGEVQLILAEKRTSLAALRTGIAIAVIPMSLATVLVTMSRFYSWLDNLQFLVPLGVLCAGLVALSIYMIARALRRLQHEDAMIRRIRKANPAVREFLDEE
ncbi:MAG: hypothetical protein HY907_11845 [Deltaproteobacteria bacterium]|nr:hypothetical protein [Deltaproteobacteria bacterium]